MRIKFHKMIFMIPLLSLPYFSYASDYKIKSPDTQNFAPNTSCEIKYIGTNNNLNVNKSKNSAYIPPIFGSPTAYILNRSDFITPNLANQIHSGTTNSTIHSNINEIITSQNVIKENYYTKVTEDLYYSNERIGRLKIPELNLNVKVYEGTDDDTLSKGIGHFSLSSVWNGNVVLCGHNRGVNNYFGKIHTLSLNDKITFSTKLGSRTYEVYSIQKISNDDFSTVLEKTTENILTLLTCVKNESSYRWCIKAKEI